AAFPVHCTAIAPYGGSAKIKLSHHCSIQTLEDGGTYHCAFAIKVGFCIIEHLKCQVVGERLDCVFAVLSRISIWAWITAVEGAGWVSVWFAHGTDHLNGWG